MIVDIVKLLIPLRKRLQIHRPDVLDSLLPQVRHQMPTDKPPRPRNENVGFWMRVSMQGSNP